MIEDTRRENVMKVRLNAEEYLALVSVARRRGTSVAACFRELLLESMQARSVKE